MLGEWVEVVGDIEVGVWLGGRWIVWRGFGGILNDDEDVDLANVRECEDGNSLGRFFWAREKVCRCRGLLLVVRKPRKAAFGCLYAETQTKPV